MDYADPKRKSNFVGKILLAAALTALCIIMLKQSPTFNTPSPVIPRLCIEFQIPDKQLMVRVIFSLIKSWSYMDRLTNKIPCQGQFYLMILYLDLVIHRGIWNPEACTVSIA